MEKVSEIRLYAITQRFKTDKGTSSYAGRIHATSLAEAQQMAKSMAAELNGEMVYSECAGCKKREVSNNSDDADWADIIE